MQPGEQRGAPRESGQEEKPYREPQGTVVFEAHLQPPH